MQAVAEVCPLVLTHCYAETASLVTEHQPDRPALQSVPCRKIVMSAWGNVVTACVMDRFQCGEVSRFPVAGRVGKRSRRAR